MSEDTQRRKRLIRSILSVVTVAAVVVSGFFVATRKAVALTVNGDTRYVSTYSLTVDRLLQEQHITVQTHDIVTSTHDGALENGDTITYCSAYEASLSIDGVNVPFWTCASSAEELLNFFTENEREAMSIKVNITNAYNQVTGGFILDGDGPVEVIADGKTTTIDNGNHTASQIFDLCGLSIGKDDIVTVEKDGDTTILRVQRVTYDTYTREVTIARGTQYVTDDTLSPGQQAVEQEGQDGVNTETVKVTYIDGVKSSEEVTSTVQKIMPVDRIIGVGPAKQQTEQNSDNSGSPNSSSGESSGGSSSSSPSASSDTSDSSSSSNSSSSTSSSASPSSSSPSSTPSSTSSSSSSSPSSSSSSSQSSSSSTPKPTQASGSSSSSSSNNSGTSGGSGGSTTGVWHATAAEAKAYARAAMKNYGWGDDQWAALETLWNRESGWLWWKKNPSSGAYGIPQALPPTKMGTGWHDNAAVQIQWGLYYISSRYGSPNNALRIWNTQGWY